MTNRWVPALARVGLVFTVALSVLLTAAGDWPTYLHDPQRTGANLDETIISPANSPQLTELWFFKGGNAIAASPTVVSGTVYAGSWDGYEYALDAATGALKWKTFVGTSITSQPGCFNTGIGVTSAATVDNGVVYVGGGDAYWYALDATSGAVLWKIFVGDNSASGGHYNWSSPLIYNGYAYVGVASLCDSPLVQGQLLQVDLTSHQIVHTFNVVPSGQTGGSIWTSPSIDPATNTLYVTTGNGSGSPAHSSSQPYSVAIVALDATTLAVKESWQVPPAEEYNDPDWTTTPLLFSDGTGRPLVAAINKDGILFALDRTNVSAGPVWQQSIAQGGANPEAGDASISSGAFDGTTLYEAGNNTIINGNPSMGSVHALDPATGNVLWQHSAPGLVYPSLAYANGLVVDGAGNYVEVLDAASGTRLYSFHTFSQVYSLSIADGQIYAGTQDGTLYALGLPATPPTATPTPQPDPGCPSGWSCQDIGNPALPGSDAAITSTYIITGSGIGIGSTADQFRFVSQSLNGDVQIAARVVTKTAPAAGSRAGLMVRQSSDPSAPFYGVFVLPNNALSVQTRIISGGATITATATLTPTQLPLYLQIERTGDSFAAATSSDGNQFTLLPGSQVTLVMPSAVLAGLAVTSHSNTVTNVAVFNSVALGPPGSPPATPTPPADPSCPAAWHCADIGNFVPFGSESVSGNTWSVQSTGWGIGAGADQFHFICKSITGNAAISARVITQTATVTSAQAGLMFRTSLAGSAPFYAAVMAPGQGVTIVVRNAKNYFSRSRAQFAGAPPLYLQIRRAGNVFSTATSPDGATWTPVPSSAVTIAMSTTVVGGLAVTSGTPYTKSTAMFDSITTAN